MADETKEQLEFSLALNTEGAAKAIAGLTKGFDQNYKKIERSNKLLNRKLMRPEKELWAQRTAYGKLEGEINKYLKIYGKEQADLLEKQTDAQTALNAAVLAGSKDGQESAKKALAAITAQQDALKEAEDDQLEGIRKIRREKQKEMDETDRDPKEMWAGLTENRPLLKEGAEGFGEGAAEAFSSLASKDALGVGKGIAKAFSKIVGATMKGGGRHLMAKADAAEAKGGAMGGAMGGLLKGLGGMLGTLGKLGPILNLVGAGFMSLVKLFLDAEAAAKDFQKEILSSSSTMEFLPKNFGDAKAASAELGETLKGVRDAAFDVSNVEWGLNKDDYSATMANLTSQGYTLAQLKKDAGETYEGVKDITQQTVHLAVAYSRNMGVALQEVTQLQGDMMGQLGMSLEQVKTAFGQMGAEAAGAQVPANQFFNIIRAMSADMSLFNNRMDQSAKILGKIMKVMNPKKAQEFIQSLSGFYKGQDLTTRIQQTAMGGLDATKKGVQEDINIKMSGLKEDLKLIKINPDDLQKAVTEGGQTLVKFLADNAKDLSAGQRSDILDAARQQAMVTEGSLVSVASALKDMSIGGVLKQVQRVASKMNNNKAIEDLTGVEILAAENYLKMSDAQIDQFAKLRVSFDLSREEMARRVEAGKASDADKEVLAKLGIKQGDDAEKAAALRHTDAIKVFDNQTTSQQAALTAAEEQTNYAKVTSEHQKSFLTQFNTYLEFFMNEFYNLVMDLWQSVSIGKGDKIGVVRAAAQSRDALVKAGGRAASEVQDSSDAAAAFAKAIATAPEWGKLMADIDALAPDQAAAAQKSLLMGVTAKQLASAMTLAHVGESEYSAEVVSKLATLDPGADVAEALKKSGFTSEDIGKIVKQLAEASGVDGVDGTKQFGARLAATRAPFLAAAAAPATEEAPKATGGRTASFTINRRPAAAEAAVPPAAVPPASAPGGTSVAGAVTKSPAVHGLQKNFEAIRDVHEAQLATNKGVGDLIDVLQIKGIRINQSHLENDIGKTFQEATLAAMEEALFEFALLTSPKAAQTALTLSHGSGGGISGRDVLGAVKQRAYMGAGVGAPRSAAPSQIAPPPVAAPAPATTAAAAQAVDVKVVLEMKGDLGKYIAQIADQQIIRRQVTAAKK